MVWSYWTEILSLVTRLLLSFYNPKKLVRVRRTIKLGSIWEALRKEFERMGQGKNYKKPYVKACFYSVIFSDGAKAMVESILKSIQKNLGLTEKEFKNMVFYKKEKYKAGKIAAAFNKLPVVKEFRLMSQQITKPYDGEVFTGSTGHEYVILNDKFRRSFA